MSGSLALESGEAKPERRMGWVSGTTLLALTALVLCWASLQFLAGEKGGLASAVGEHTNVAAVLVVVLCAAIARQGPTPPAPEVVPVEKRPDYGQVCLMSFLLCGASGMVNAVAIIQMGGCVAHMSGNTSHFGRLLGIDAGRFAMLLSAFVFGTGIAGFTKADGEALFRGRYCPCLMSAAVAISMGVLLHRCSNAGLGLTEEGNWVTMPLWAFGNGMLNGVMSRFSSMPLRVTHHTGTLTDAGMGVGLWLRARLGGEATPNMQKNLLLWICFAGFAAGGLAAHLETELGILAGLPPAATMAVLALNPGTCC